MSITGNVILNGRSARGQTGFPICLTHRQSEVLLLLCEGMPNKLIGRKLGVSGNTVKTHVASVLHSLNAATRLEAVAIAFKLGLVQSVTSLPEQASGAIEDLASFRVTPRVALAA